MLLLQSSSWVNKYLHHFSSWFTFCLALFFSHKSSEVGGFTISHSRLHFQPWGLTFEQHYNYTTGRLLLELHFFAQCIIVKHIQVYSGFSIFTLAPSPKKRSKSLSLNYLESYIFFHNSWLIQWQTLLIAKWKNRK